MSQHRDRHSPELSVEIHSDENDFNDHSDSQSECDGSCQSRQPLKDEIADSEAIKFSSLVEEILKLLPEDKFPREPERDPSDCRPRSSIQMDQERAPRKSISLPQSSVVKTTIERIAKNLSKTPPVDNWCPGDKDVLSVAGLKFYKAHCEFFPTAEPAQLDRDASRLDLSLKGSCSFPVKSLESYEKYSRDILRTLSHADILSFAAYKSLRQKELDPKLLERTLDSLSVAIRDSIGVASLMAVGLQQARRDAAIHSASKSLTDESKQSLRNVPITSSKLFGGEIDEIYKRNVQANRDKLVDNAVSQQSKSQQSTNASGKRSAQPPKKKPAPQKAESSTTEVSKIPPQSGRGGRRGGSFRGSSYRGRGAPLMEGPLPLRNTEDVSPLPLPLPQVPVGGRLAHFVHNWQSITDDPWVLSIIRRGYLIPFSEPPPLSEVPIFFNQSKDSRLEEEVANLLLKGAVEKINPVSPGFYSRIFIVPKKNGKSRLIIDLSPLNKYVCVQNFRMETQRKVRNAIYPNDWAFSLDLTDAYLHVPIHKQSRKFLRFSLNGQIFQFKALAFGLSTSPFVFTYLMNVIATFLRKRAIILHPYLDDWLARNQCRRTLLEHRHYLMSLITSLGLIINYEKSELVPTQTFTFIGMEFLTNLNLVRVPQDKVYDAKWRVYLDWANKRQIDPIKATPNVIADFLTFLFNEKKCQVSTIRGYRSMISNTLKFSAGFDIGSHPVLSDLITSFQLQRPISRSLAPKWDLAFVLSHICKAPFEPLSPCSLFHLSLKSAFLIAMATAKRVSEIHAFSIDKDHFRFSHIDGSLTLRTQPGFLAKNQLPSKAPDSIRIPKLSNHYRSSDFNHKLCPIRAIKAYIDRTKSIRNGRTRLFIPTKGDHDLKKSTISSWIKYTISHAYKSLSKHQIKLLKVKAHELRALSTSWAYTSSIPLEEVIKAAVWSNSSTFASFYLRNMGSQAENLRQMGPIVAAQRMVGGGGPTIRSSR